MRWNIKAALCFMAVLYLCSVDHQLSKAGIRTFYRWSSQRVNIGQPISSCTCSPAVSLQNGKSIKTIWSLQHTMDVVRAGINIAQRVAKIQQIRIMFFTCTFFTFSIKRNYVMLCIFRIYGLFTTLLKSW